MYPLDTQTQKLVAQEHVERLRHYARPAPKRPEPDRAKRPTGRLRPAANRLAL
jgi:hypothetical protein